jgi:hypothetical protein
MAKRDGQLREVLAGYADSSQGNLTMMIEHRPWLQEFLLFADAHAG